MDLVFSGSGSVWLSPSQRAGFCHLPVSVSTSLRSATPPPASPSPVRSTPPVSGGYPVLTVALVLGEGRDEALELAVLRSPSPKIPPTKCSSCAPGPMVALVEVL